jgi:GT2 family glycosyltransferase
MSSVDAIIVTYQSSFHVGGAIACLAAASEVGRVIVVDNASGDESAAAARLAGADVVRQNTRNVGFASAVNLGLQDAAADFVLLLNPDARLAPDALRRMVATLAREHEAAIVAPLLRDNGRMSTGAGRTATVARRVGLCIPLVGRARCLRPEYPPPPVDGSAVARAVDVDYVFGAAMLLARDFLQGAGGLDERFFLFAEDEDICRCARAAGRRVLLDGGAVADHIGGASCPDGTATEAQRLFSTYRLLAKWDGPRAATAYHHGIMGAFGLRTAAARAGLTNTVPRAIPPAPTSRTTAAEVWRTARLFDEAVRSGLDPLVRLQAAVSAGRGASVGGRRRK